MANFVASLIPATLPQLSSTKVSFFAPSSSPLHMPDKKAFSKLVLWHTKTRRHPLIWGPYSYIYVQSSSSSQFACLNPNKDFLPVAVKFMNMRLLVEVAGWQYQTQKMIVLLYGRAIETLMISYLGCPGQGQHGPSLGRPSSGGCRGQRVG